MLAFIVWLNKKLITELFNSILVFTLIILQVRLTGSGIIHSSISILICFYFIHVVIIIIADKCFIQMLGTHLVTFLKILKSELSLHIILKLTWQNVYIFLFHHEEW